MKLPAITRTIRVDGNHRIGEGVHGDVYRISPRRIVKAFGDEEDAEGEYIMSRKYKYVLPVLDVVYVVDEYDTKRIGLVKRYLPFFASARDRRRMWKRYRSSSIGWDIHDENVMKDSRGYVYIIDAVPDI